MGFGFRFEASGFGFRPEGSGLESRVGLYSGCESLCPSLSSPNCLLFRVRIWGLSFGVEGLEFRVQGSGFGFMVEDLRVEIRVRGLGFQVEWPGLRLPLGCLELLFYKSTKTSWYNFDHVAPRIWSRSVSPSVSLSLSPSLSSALYPGPRSNCTYY